MKNIYSKPGTKVKVTVDENKNVINGRDYDKEQIKKYIFTDKIYTVSYIEVENWSSAVYFEETGEIGFNTVCFEEI